MTGEKTLSTRNDSRPNVRSRQSRNDKSCLQPLEIRKPFQQQLVNPKSYNRPTPYVQRQENEPYQHSQTRHNKRHRLSCSKEIRSAPQRRPLQNQVPLAERQGYPEIEKRRRLRRKWQKPNPQEQTVQHSSFQRQNESFGSSTSRSEQEPVDFNRVCDQLQTEQRGGTETSQQH